MMRTTADITYKQTNYKILRDRELGLKKCIGTEDDLSRKLYSNIDFYDNGVILEYNYNQGGIFNLEFSPDGQLLVAACEGRTVLLFDAFNSTFIKQIPKAHLRCVNCVRFLDKNTFATCSDDGTIKTWDLRFLKTSTRTLQGHSNWVKNIEYSEREQVLVTSGFDGSIYSWNLKNNHDISISYNKVFKMSGLMRMKITPDDTKMIITTTTGYMIIVHDLNLSTMYNDLKDFHPHLYRLMQMGDEALPEATSFNPLFTSSRNRVEFVVDFPNKAELISSVQIHPMGWSALTRNISDDNNTEWTCVHDIQMKEPKYYDDIYTYIQSPELEETNESVPDNLIDIWQGLRTLDQTERSVVNHRPRVNFMNSGLLHRLRNPCREPNPEDKNRMVKNLPRLTHFIQEQVMRRGYIKELCFSSDGRIIASPYGKGVRLLAFNERCQEICDCLPDEPQQLVPIVNMQGYHLEVVVSCKFNPRHYQMVTGCLDGGINWYRPVL
ncbi:DDB1- and CUL4-associated factor 10 [Onthophagus taurus]|uniref:DDB1- and CUL4-associated factor 10 n=1 Tax=Onthophagus taurus TaxID=166361 RepID=UPI000C20ECB9|nr:DDB1- and CUL4-associated factor 10 homolog [Onthophagus taurus]